MTHYVDYNPKVHGADVVIYAIEDGPGQDGVIPMVLREVTDPAERKSAAQVPYFYVVKVQEPEGAEPDRVALARQWTAATIAAGFTPADAVRWTKEALDALPEGANPRTWLPDPDAFAASAVIDEAAIQDAQADWHEHAPQEFKSLLDAKPAGRGRRKRRRG